MGESREGLHEKALKFLGSMRGNYIVSQALVLAIKEMKSRPLLLQEPSNLSDMEFLLDNLFPIYQAIDRVNREAQFQGTLDVPLDKDIGPSQGGEKGQSKKKKGVK